MDVVKELLAKEGITTIWSQWAEALMLLLIGWIVIRVLLRIERKAVEKSRIDPSVYVVIQRATGITLWILLGLTVLSKLGVDMAPLVTALAAAGVAVALALRDSLSNVAGGIILIFTQPFVAGDEIEIDGTVGVVDHIDLLTTHLHTYDNRDVIVPNGNVTTTTVINASRRELRRMNCEFIIGYEEDVEEARQAVLSVVKESPLLLGNPEPWICVNRQTRDGLVLEIGIWCKTEQRYDALCYMETAIKEALDRQGIRLAYPHIDIEHVNTTSPK